MLPLAVEVPPVQTTVPLRLFAGRVPSGAMVTPWACEAAKYGVPALAGSPSWLGSVQNCPLRWMTTSWYSPAGIRASGRRSAPRAKGSTITSSRSCATGGAPGARFSKAGSTDSETAWQGMIAPDAIEPPAPSKEVSCRRNTRGKTS